MFPIEAAELKRFMWQKPIEMKLNKLRFDK